MAFSRINAEGMCQIGNSPYPAIGFGTYPLKNETCLKAVDEAAKLGYRIIDTATFYGNLEPIGHVLKKLGREQFYVISKVWPDSHTADKLKADLKQTLKLLQTDYLDAYLLHWPNSAIPIEETLQAMESLRKQGKLRHIGLSNVTVAHLKRALELNIPIAWVQVEMNPFFYDEPLLHYCQEKGINIQAWAPLRRGNLTDPLLAELGKKYGKTSSQIALRWILQHGCIPLPGSKNPQHMRENLEITDFALTEDEMSVIDQKAKVGDRERVTMAMGVGFTDEFDYTYEQCWPKKPINLR